MDTSASAAPAATDPAPANGLSAFGASLDKANIPGAAFTLHPPFFLNLKEKEPASPRKERSVPDVAMLDEAALPSPRSKRQASPTELVHESPSGDPRLVKRPSVKRKQRSSDEESSEGEKAGAHFMQQQQQQQQQQQHEPALILAAPPPGSGSR